MNQGLEAARRRRQELIEAGISPTMKDPITKARENPQSLRLAVNAKCWDCCGAGADPNPRGAIRECPCSSCPLHPVRPYQKTRSRGDDHADA